ncbi:MAG TPA: glycine cleavage T C-terminal barrel domain-containing protein [Solirubrobacterales bacterium]|nr:glycine cleavage T C-terminal barrel domain-containing protein [Solirubrobacterales bacterium]
MASGTDTTTVPDSTTLYFGPWYGRSPYFEATLRAGCSAYDVYNHTYIPAYYDDPAVEYDALLNGVTLWDVGVEHIVQIKGPDALEFTNLLTCRDLTKCEVGQCKYAPLIDADGGIVNDPVLLRPYEDTFWLALADSDAGLWARGVAWGAELGVEISDPPTYPVQVQGPKAKDVVSSLFGDEVLEMRYYHCMHSELDGIPVVLGRTGWTGEIGYEIYLRDPERGDELWNRVMEAGAPHDIRPIAPCEARRIEAGIFNYRSDMTLENNPFEVTGLERLVEEQERSYIGKDALERIRVEGVSRKLVGVEIRGDPLEWELTQFWPAYSNGERVGRATIAIRSPGLDKNIGYVWVPIELADPGNALELELPDGSRRAATTASLPFVDPKKRKPAA